MATAPPSHPRYEPKPRYGHCSALVEGKWISYGGLFGADGGFADPPTSVDVFDVNSEMWEQVSTTGTPPPGVLGAACTAVGSKIYHFGGTDGKQFYNVLHCLDTKTKVWSSITPNNPEASPMMKHSMAVTSYKKLVVFIGGYGDKPTNRHQDVHYVDDPEREGEVVCYDTEQNMWLRPTITGTLPPPCQDMSLTRVDSHRAVMFGGVGEGNELMSPDVYILDMLHWTWTKIPASQTPQHPCARLGHSAVSLHDPDCDPANPALLVMWGTGGDDDEVLRDCWIFHLNQKLWRKMILPETLRGRAFHTSSILYFSLVTKCINFGGLYTISESDEDAFAPIAQTTIVEMSCSGGNPAEWIITDVITSSQLGQGNRLPKHMQLSMEEEMRHLTACDEAMRRKGKVDYCFGACLLNGPPRVGKSTFFYRITGRRLLPSDASCETTSTGVAERILQVVIKKSSSYIARAIEPGMNWQIVTLSQEAVTMLKAILSSQSSLVLQSQVQPPSLPPASEFESLSLSSEAVDTTADETITDRQPVAGGVSGATQTHMRMFGFRRLKKKSRQIRGYQVPLEIFQKALRSKEWASAEDLLKHSINLGFSDVGGQPEFQEVLPAIIAGPSVFFILFKLPDSLSQKYRVQYIESITRKTITYESSFTVKESILCSLSSASSMCRFVTRSSSELEPINPKVFIVATHKDKADKKHIKNVQRELKDTLESTEFYKKGIVVFASQSEPAFTINNLSDDDKDVSNIRQRVEKILAEDPSFKVSVPAPWLALSLSLRLVESSVISYESCCTIANDCGIDDEEEIKEALWFLHNKLGVIRYFDQVPELRDIVICDPQVIFDILTNLITRTFTFEETQDACASEEFQHKGIFPSRMIDKISSHLNEPLTGSKVIILLKHLRVIAEIFEEQDESPSHYLVPCSLSHADHKKKPSFAEKVSTFFQRGRTTVPSLCILFRCGYCPKGIFGALVADLMNLSSTRLRWRLINDAIFRDQASFIVGPEHHIVVISSHITFVKVDVSANTAHAKSVQRNPKAVCNMIRIDIELSLINVSKTLHYGSGAAFSFGFHCTSCSGSPPADCGDEDDPVVMSCRKCKSVDLNEKHSFWFGEKVTSLGVLTTTDLPIIMEKIWDARVKWYNIGLGLRINPGTLDAIEKNNRNVDDQFRDMLGVWLKTNQPQPTKALLAEALQSRIVGYGYLAEHILSL